MKSIKDEPNIGSELQKQKCQSRREMKGESIKRMFINKKEKGQWLCAHLSWGEEVLIH